MLPSTTGSLKSSKQLILRCIEIKCMHACTVQLTGVLLCEISGQKMDVVPDDTVSVIIESGMESVDISRNNFSSLPSWYNMPLALCLIQSNLTV